MYSAGDVLGACKKELPRTEGAVQTAMGAAAASRFKAMGAAVASRLKAKGLDATVSGLRLRLRHTNFLIHGPG